jgi:hypothetical protein
MRCQECSCHYAFSDVERGGLHPRWRLLKRLFPRLAALRLPVQRPRFEEAQVIVDAAGSRPELSRADGAAGGVCVYGSRSVAAPGANVFCMKRACP